MTEEQHEQYKKWMDLKRKAERVARNGDLALSLKLDLEAEELWKTCVSKFRLHGS